MEKLGIIGGMGPGATARLFTRVVDLTDVACDQDHVDVTVLNRPSVPDRTAYLLHRAGAQSFMPELERMTSDLEAAGCTVLAMPCNTAHACADEIQQGLRHAHLVDMPREAVSFIRELGSATIGVLATDGTLSAGVFQHAVTDRGATALVPDDANQKRVMSIIYDYVKAGLPVPEGELEAVFDALIDAGCDGFILGCTELSLLGAPVRYRGLPVVDALDVLAWRCVQACGAPARDLKADFA